MRKMQTCELGTRSRKAREIWGSVEIDQNEFCTMQFFLIERSCCTLHSVWKNSDATNSHTSEKYLTTFQVDIEIQIVWNLKLLCIEDRTVKMKRKCGYSYSNQKGNIQNLIKRQKYFYRKIFLILRFCYENIPIRLREYRVLCTESTCGITQPRHNPSCSSPKAVRECTLQGKLGEVFQTWHQFQLHHYPEDEARLTWF